MSHKLNKDTTPLICECWNKVLEAVSVAQKNEHGNVELDNPNLFYFRGEDKNYTQTTSSLFRIMSSDEKNNPIGFIRKIIMLEKSIDKLLPTDKMFVSTMTKLRHDGICTPLIDLTESFYVALFFACIPKEVEIEKDKWEYQDGCIKVFKRNDFMRMDELKFNEKYYNKLFLSGPSRMDVVIESNNWMHPNIRKQQSIICISKSGTIDPFAKIAIEENKKSDIIKELSEIGYSLTTLFTKKEGIQTDLLLDDSHKKSKIVFTNKEKELIESLLNPRPFRNSYELLEEKSKAEKIMKEKAAIFNKVLMSYNNGIYDFCSSNSITRMVQKNLLFTYFYNVYDTEGTPEFLHLILRFLELEIIASDIEEYLESRYKNLGERIYEIILKNNLLEMLNTIFSPKRLLSVDTKLKSFCTQINAIMSKESSIHSNKKGTKSALWQVVINWWNFLKNEIEYLVYNYKKVGIFVEPTNFVEIFQNLNNEKKMYHKEPIMHLNSIIWILFHVHYSNLYYSYGKKSPLLNLKSVLERPGVFKANEVCEIIEGLSNLFMENASSEFMANANKKEWLELLKGFIEKMRSQLENH